MRPSALGPCERRLLQQVVGEQRPHPLRSVRDWDRYRDPSRLMRRTPSSNRSATRNGTGLCGFTSDSGTRSVHRAATILGHRPDHR